MSQAVPGARKAAAPASSATQVRRPWRATARTVVQGLLALAVVLPVLVQELGLDPTSIPVLAAVLAGLAGFARLMALPQVEALLRRYLPFLAAEPRK